MLSMNGIMCCVIVIAPGSGIETQTEIAKFETYQIQQSGYRIIEIQRSITKNRYISKQFIQNTDSDTIVLSSSWSATNNVINPVTTITSKQPPLCTTAKGKMPTVSLSTTNRLPHSGTVGGGDNDKAALLAMTMMAHATKTR